MRMQRTKMKCLICDAEGRKIRNRRLDKYTGLPFCMKHLLWAEKAYLENSRSGDPEEDFLVL
jgi:hypothetical protein